MMLPQKYTKIVGDKHSFRFRFQPSRLGQGPVAGPGVQLSFRISPYSHSDNREIRAFSDVEKPFLFFSAPLFKANDVVINDSLKFTSSDSQIC